MRLAPHPKELPEQKKMVILGGIVIAVLMLIIGIFWYINQRPIDPEVIYTERVAKAGDSLDIMQSIDDIASTSGDIESQLNAEDYETYLGIENSTNKDTLAQEYGHAQSVGTDIAQMVEEHETHVKELGGITDVQGMIAIDTLPVQNQELRNTMLANMGVTPEQYATLKNKYESEKGKVERTNEVVELPTHDHDHDHHDHAH